MQHPTQTTQTLPDRVLRRRNSRGVAMTTEELTSQPPGTEERPMTPERTYARVVSPAPATLPKPVDASMTVGGDIASTPNQGERPARVYTEKLPQGTDARTHLQVEAAEDKDGPWTVATGRTTRTHRESISSRKSSPADRVSVEVDQARGQLEEITSIVDEAAALMSPEVLRLIADRYASLASAVEQRTPALRPESPTDTTPESKDESEAIGGAAEKLDTEPGPDDSPESEPEGSDGHPYHLGEAEWSEETQEPENPLAGPSRDKGKGPDPGNWGGINISESELEYQRDAWKAFELAREGKHRRSPVVTPVERGHPLGGSAPLPRDTTSVKGEEMGAVARDQGVFMREFKRMRERLAELEERESLRRASRPAASPVENLRRASAEISTLLHPKIVKKWSPSKTKPNGFVTSVLRGVSLQPSEDSGSSPDPSSGDSDSEGEPTDSSSGESGSEYGSSDSSSDSESSDSDSSGPRSKKKPSKKKKKSSKQARGKMLVKPNPPARYDGSENADLYTQFVDESNRYCELGNVPKAHRVPIVGSFLDGDAKDFYNRRIRGQEHKWTLKKMLQRLLKYCFSLDYRQKQRKRLNRCHQNGKSVNKHVLELESILLQIGLKKDRERVALLWNSFDADIQEELFRFGLDPEKSRWKRVVKKAIRAERFLNLDKRRKGRDTTTAGASTGPGKSGLDRDERKRRFFPRKQGGVSHSPRI
ncbi:unnamed protein product [Mycena citricolor]|uniref:Retrotransposon gag domain-containing protein n=1 Tax=Mycena citricolor TaxID=2018698 RepID=A0AAD2Q3N3_9AGAR|nr:unnamed protein product [Mycena citricolor]